MKRFTETQKWDDPWFLELEPHLKLLWLWLCDRCDHAGIIEPSMKLASFHIGYQYPMDALSAFSGRLEEIGGGKYLLTKFIQFQYGGISRDCKAHNPVFASLQKHGVEFSERVSKGYPKGIHTHKDKDKDKDTVKNKDKDTESASGRDEAIEAIWKAFPSNSRARSSKKELAAAWAKTKPKPSLDEILPAIAAWSTCHEWTKQDGQFAKGAHLWIKLRKWEVPPPTGRDAGDIMNQSTNGTDEPIPF